MASVLLLLLMSLYWNALIFSSEEMREVLFHARYNFHNVTNKRALRLLEKWLLEYFY
jgi:hypothetical protein